MRPKAFLFAALFLATPLAGCLGSATATALELTPRARAIASAWQGDAVLEGVVGVEMKELPPVVRAALSKEEGQGPQKELLQYSDDNVGDGRAGAWLFGFRSGDQELALVLDAGGRELMRDESASAHGKDAVLGDVAIDSDKAMALAADHNATFARLRGHAFLASLALVPGPSGPLWVLVLAGSLEDASPGDSAFAMVDATSGNVTTGDDLGDAFASAFGDGSASSASVASPFYDSQANRTFVRTETGTRQGTLTVASPDDPTEFEVEVAGHSTLRLQITLPNAPPATQATATVTAPDGRTAAVSFTGSVSGQGPATAEMPSPQPGTYKVAIHLDSGVLQRYSLAWCAPGSRMSAQDASSACGVA